jgi:glucose dehydrogenase
MKKTLRSFAMGTVILMTTSGCLRSPFTPAGPGVIDGDVLTYHNDSMRTGQNTHETLLNRSNVNASHFGKIGSLPVDGQVYAQPLVVKGVSINKTKHDVVYVATEHDSVYAFDANSLSTTPLWKRSFLGDAVRACHNCTTLGYLDVNAPNIVPEIGITATPVIDADAGIMYVSAVTMENGTAVARLHGLELASGKEILGSPIAVNPSLPGTTSDVDTRNGLIHFNAIRQLSRSGLVLSKGKVIIAYSSYNDQ